MRNPIFVRYYILETFALPPKDGMVAVITCLRPPLAKLGALTHNMCAIISDVCVLL